MKIIYNDGHTADCPAEEELEVLRHSAAHIMAQAVKRLYPQAHFAYGPATEKGFHYDIDLGEIKLGDEDLPAIEKEMQKIVKENLPFKVYPLPRQEAVKLMEDRGEVYKVEHIADLPELIRIKKHYGCFLMVDEAHSLGVLGKRGRGLCEHWECDPADTDIWMGTLSKTFCGCGGYIAGRKDLVEMAADRLTAPGIGKDLGANFNQNNNFFKGLFMSPSAVRSALKTAVFSAYMMEKLGYTNVSPKYNEKRTDIIQTVELGNKDSLVSFTQGIQESSPIDSFVKVLPAPMPGYPFDEVMACGAFTQGSTIELSADAPVVEPYTLYLQGGLSLEYGRLSIMLALSKAKKHHI